MPNTTSKVDELDICTAIVAINGVVAASVKTVNGLTKKSCGQANCNVIELGLSTFSCGRACIADCIEYYTDAEAGDLPTDGNHIYDNSSCECEGGEGTIYYSNKCGGRSGNCWTVRQADCVVVGVSEC